MNFGEFLLILRARRWVALLVIVLTIGTTITLSLLLPKKYTATASLVVDLKPDPVNPFIQQAVAIPAYIATQVDVIRSDRVAQRVIRNLGLAESPEVRAAWVDSAAEGVSIEAWLVELLQQKTDVKPSKESNVITVLAKDGDAQFAAKLANAVVQAYLDTGLELRVDPAKQYTAFFDSRAKELRAELERAQAKVSAFQREKGIVATDERLDIETARLNELSSQRTILQALSSESGSRQFQAQGAGADRLQEVVNNPLVQGLRTELTRAEARLQELNARLGDNHPLVLESKATISTLRSRIETESRRVAGSVGVTNSINRQRENENRAALEAQRALVLRMKAVRDEGAVLYRDVENAQRAYEAVLTRLNQTSLESQATQSNVYVLSAASQPLKPSFPKLGLNAAVSVAIGAILAIGVVLLLERMDRRVRSARDITELVQLPVLGIMRRAGKEVGLAGGSSVLALGLFPRRPMSLPPVREEI